MRIFRHAFTVSANIDKVWEFYTDIEHLQVVSPPHIKLRLVRSTDKRLVQNSEVWLSGILLTRSNWHSKITSLGHYQYVDEMLSGRFRVWKHVHGLRKIDDNTTEVIDEIYYELHYGLLGRIFEGYVYSQLERIFAYRKQATVNALES
jgi:ligand-binding SRPBCC domain-containing protein